MKFKQHGSILIVVLWIISISLVLISVLAKNSRLSATIVMHQQQALNDWAKMLGLINLTKMEIVLKQKKQSPFARLGQRASGKSTQENYKYIFNGDKVKLSYAGYEDMIVRIYDLSGKLNISNINRARFKQILIKRVGQEDKQVDELMDAWEDWTDNDSLKRLNGAEKSYYNKLDTPYSPRNGSLQSVSELNLIKGFEQVFEKFDYTKAFTLYGVKQAQINPNIANKETLLLIPGITEELADEIIATRQQQAFKNIAEFRSLIPSADVSKTNGWFALSKSRFYAIVIYSKQTEKDAIVKEDGSTEVYVYQEIIQVLSGNKKPKTLRVFPSYKIRIAPKTVAKQSTLTKRAAVTKKSATAKQDSTPQPFSNLKKSSPSSKTINLF